MVTGITNRIGTVDYTYMVSDHLDISKSTHLIYPHGGDIWGNIYDWRYVNNTSTNATNTTNATNSTA